MTNADNGIPVKKLGLLIADAEDVVGSVVEAIDKAMRLDKTEISQ